MTRTGGLLKYDSQYVMGESLNGYLMPQDTLNTTMKATA